MSPVEFTLKVTAYQFEHPFVTNSAPPQGDGKIMISPANKFQQTKINCCTATLLTLAFR